MYKHVESTTMGNWRRKHRAPAHRKKTFSEVFTKQSLSTIKKKIWSWPTAYSRARTVDSGCSAGPGLLSVATPSAWHPRGSPDDSSPGSCGTSTSYLQKRWIYLVGFKILSLSASEIDCLWVLAASIPDSISSLADLPRFLHSLHFCLLI